MTKNEPPIFGPNGAVLNSGIIPPEKIGQYDGSEPTDYGQDSPYTDTGSRYAWVANFLLHIVLVTVAFVDAPIPPKVALGAVIASIGLSFMALRHVKDETKHPALKRQTFGDLILVVPLSYALLILNTPVSIGLLSFVWASLIIRFLLWLVSRAFPSVGTPR